MAYFPEAVPFDYVLYKDRVGRHYLVGTKPGLLDFEAPSKEGALAELLARYPSFSGTVYDKEANEVRSYEGGELVATHPVWKASPQLPASYIIFQEGGRVYAKSGRTGQVEFQGSDAAEVIQSAIDALGTIGSGTLFVKRAAYLLDKPLDFRPWAWTRCGIFCEDGAVLKADAEMSNLVELIGKDEPNGQFLGQRFHFYELDGNDKADNCIVIRYANDCMIEIVNVHNAKATGVFINEGGEPKFGCFNNLIRIGRIADCGGTGLKALAPTTGTIGVEGNTIVIGHIIGGNDGIGLGDEKGERIFNNRFIIGAIDEVANYCVYDRSGGNVFIGDFGSLSGIRKNVIIGRVEGDVENVQEHLVLETYHKWKNSGTATFSGDGSTDDFEIGAHGLAVTDPEKIVVKVTPISPDAIAASPCVGYVDPADNTKIRVKFASAPASGTDNVKVAWEARVI